MSVLKSHLYAMSAYTPPLEGRDPQQYLLLDFNERTLPVSENVQRALIEYISSGRMQMYPAYGDIVPRLAEYVGVEPSHLMITNGSDQGIELLFRATCSAGDEVIIPVPSFAMYHQCAKVENAKIIEPQYTRETGFPVEGVLSVISDRTKIICIANPNNPSGVAISRENILRIAEAAKHAAVLVDECYFEYSQETVVDCLVSHPNLFITRTFSKTWGMPSLRFGYLMASEANIQALLTVRGPYDVNQLAVVAAGAALSEPEVTERYVTEVMRESKPMFEAFLDAQAISYWPSHANFVWLFPQAPERVEQALVAAGILVRPKADFEGRMGLRVTLGTREQTERLISVLQGVLAE
ncbi:Histidinol-phosphate aminotransferase [Thalassocella blandensis]|nr:Histidinol-phosphate aminotransferase [Thalassocella blandensis]